MTSVRVPDSVVLGLSAVSLVMTLAACNSHSDANSANSGTEAVASSAPEAGTSVSECPIGPPQNGSAPEWTLAGAIGNVAVTAPTDTAAPKIDIGAPFSVAETQVQTLKAGDGPVVTDTETVLVCYMGVNGRDGAVFDSSYETGASVDFPLDGVIPGFRKAIAGQKVGSTVVVAMSPADGYPQGQPSAGIEQGDSLVFAIKIIDAWT